MTPCILTYGTPVKSTENRNFCKKNDLNVLYPLVMFLKLMLTIYEVLINVLVCTSQVAALNWSDTIYPNLRYPRQKHRKSTFLQERLSESASDISDVPETYVENSRDACQRFGINQLSGRAQLKWHNTTKLRVPPSKTPKIDIIVLISDLNVLFALVMFLKLMLTIVEVLSNALALISLVVAFNWIDTKCPNLDQSQSQITCRNPGTN